jgi:hypothetical protein
MSSSQGRYGKHRFAIKGVFSYLTVFGGNRRGRKVQYESRIVVVSAGSEEKAHQKAHHTFLKSEWTAEWPMPYIATQRCEYLGIADSLTLGGEMDECEVWYEFSVAKPGIAERAHRAARRSKRVSGQRQRTRRS